LIRALRRVEEGVLVLALTFATLLPLSEAIGRQFGGLHVPGAAAWVQHLTLWLVFVGGLLTTREGKHLVLSTTEFLGQGQLRRVAQVASHAVAAATCAVLAYAAVALVLANREEGKVLPGGVPSWLSECVMPVCLALMALRFAWAASPGWRGRALAVATIGLTFGLGLVPQQAAHLAWPLGLGLLAASLLGAPVFVAMGALALLLFFKDGTPVAAVSAEVYRLISSPTLPAIPLLTAAGYVLAEGAASSRLLRVFRALFGWLPGGLAVMVAAVCALFTTFTGGSGVTIIALGGLVYPILRKDGYPANFSLGLVTASGSLGLLFPPSLPVILYAVVASQSQQGNVAADSLYIAGLLPGLLMVAAVAGYGMWMGRRAGTELQGFSGRELASACWDAKWELSLPLVVIFVFAAGLASMVETSALALAYAVVTQCLIIRDIPLRQLPQALVRAAALMGAVLVLLSVAMGLTSYLVDAQVAEWLTAFVRQHIHSQFGFLLALNLLLLVVGCLIDIFSAIVVVVPLITPAGAAFGVDPLHLGIIFLANLELGFLTPPVGMNLFLASSRFERPLLEVYRDAVPFLLILGLCVLVITYVPWLSLALPEVLGKATVAP
jgi:tripartite ATP-independent transporter DctM subunit